MSQSPQMLLPRNLAALAKCCAVGEQIRYGATIGVQLEATEEGYRATVTDGRQLVSVTGPSADKPENYPTFPALESAPNSGTCNVIGSKEWAGAFKMIPKQGRAFHKPILDNLATVLGKDVTTFGATNLESCAVQTPRNLDGKFPDCQRAMPGGRPRFTLDMDPAILGKVLSVVDSFTDDESRRVTLAYFGPGAPFRITSNNTDGQQVTAVVMPLTIGGRKNAMKHPNAPIQDVLRTLARLATVWYRAAGNYNSVLCQRCKAAHAALTAKYLS